MKKNSNRWLVGVGGALAVAVLIVWNVQAGGDDPGSANGMAYQAQYPGSLWEVQKQTDEENQHYQQMVLANSEKTVQLLEEIKSQLIQVNQNLINQKMALPVAK